MFFLGVCDEVLTKIRFNYLDFQKTISSWNFCKFIWKSFRLKYSQEKWRLLSCQYCTRSKTDNMVTSFKFIDSILLEKKIPLKKPGFHRLVHYLKEENNLGLIFLKIYFTLENSL